MVALCHSNVPCTFCLYHPRDGIPYDQRVHKPRDATKIMLLTDRALKYERRRAENRVAIKAGKKRKTTNKGGARAKKRLKSMGMYPVDNPFHFTPMGAPSNNIYRGTPIDLFHVFCAGLMKAGVFWTLTIISEISKKHPAHNNSAALFDSRLIQFPPIPEAPHIPKTTFKNGLLFKLLRNTTEADRSSASSAGGGYRSSHWITAMFQMIFVIGTNGDILPNAKKFMFNGENLGNVQAKVLDCFYCMLSCYFECKRSSISETEAKKIGRYCTVLYARFSILWDLKQAVMNMPLEKRVTSMRKPHQLLHIQETIEYFASLSKCNTDTFETTNSTFGVQVNRRASGRKDTRLHELSKDVALLDLVEAFQIIKSITMDGKQLGPPPGKEEVEFRALNNVAHVRLQIVDLEVDPIPRGYLNFVPKTIKEDTVLCHSALNTPDYSTLEVLISKHLISLAIPLESWPSLQLRLLSGIVYEGNVESKMGKGTIYGTHSFGSNKKPRYDFVTVSATTIGLQSTKSLAQVVAAIEIMEGTTAYHALVVQYLAKDGIPKARQAKTKRKEEDDLAKEYFPKYTWEILGYAGQRAKFNVDIVDTSSVVGPATVVPDFTLNQDVLKPKITDRFYYVCPEWIDRGGYIDDDGFEMPDLQLGNTFASAGGISVGAYIIEQQTTRRNVERSFPRLRYDMEDLSTLKYTNVRNRRSGSDEEEDDEEGGIDAEDDVDDDKEDEDAEQEEAEDDDDGDEMDALDTILDVC